jgi:hypothetical protein
VSNIISISTFLFTSSLLIQERKIKVLIVLVELITWFTFLLILKGGYAYGMGASARDEILFYDFAGLLMRLWLFIK